MATTHSTATRNALCSAVNTAVNSGTTNPNGQIVIHPDGAEVNFNFVKA